MTINPKSRWPRFSLRTLFVVVTLFGCWLGYEWNWIRQRREVLPRCQWAYRFYEPVGYNEIPPRTGPRAPNLLWLFGEFGYGSIGLRFETEHARPNLTEAEEKEVERVRLLFPEAEHVRFRSRTRTNESWPLAAELANFKLAKQLFPEAEIKIKWLDRGYDGSYEPRGHPSVFLAE